MKKMLALLSLLIVLPFANEAKAANHSDWPPTPRAANVVVGHYFWAHDGAAPNPDYIKLAWDSPAATFPVVGKLGLLVLEFEPDPQPAKYPKPSAIRFVDPKTGANDDGSFGPHLQDLFGHLKSTTIDVFQVLRGDGSKVNVELHFYGQQKDLRAGLHGPSAGKDKDGPQVIVDSSGPGIFGHSGPAHGRAPGKAVNPRPHPDAASQTSG